MSPFNYMKSFNKTKRIYISVCRSETTLKTTKWQTHWVEVCKIGRKSAESVVAITSNRLYTPLPGVNITHFQSIFIKL